MFGYWQSVNGMASGSWAFRSCALSWETASTAREPRVFNSARTGERTSFPQRSGATDGGPATHAAAAADAPSVAVPFAAPGACRAATYGRPST